jgi:pimeloyl-ACP methyl ester carboxylesterase
MKDLHREFMKRSIFLKHHPSSFLFTNHFSFHHLARGAGSPVILLHGGGVWLYSFRHNVNPLSGMFSVYAMDMPGYGFTGIRDPSLALDLDCMTLAIRELMDGLHLSSASFVGHSWGGGWVLAFALRYPERVEKIVLIDSGGLDVPDVPEWELLRMPLAGRLFLRFLTPAMVQKSLRLSFFRQDLVDDAMTREVYLPLKISANRRAQARISRNLSWASVESRLGLLPHQTLLIWGDRDRYLDVRLTERFRSRIKDLRVEIIEDCGHSPHEETPDRVNMLTRRFLEP